MHNFDAGFAKGIALWNDGLTAELISHRAEKEIQRGAEAYGLGMNAASKALLGWIQDAERDAVLYGFTREDARKVVNRHLSKAK